MIEFTYEEVKEALEYRGYINIEPVADKCRQVVAEHKILGIKKEFTYNYDNDNDVYVVISTLNHLPLLYLRSRKKEELLTLVMGYKQFDKETQTDKLIAIRDYITNADESRLIDYKAEENREEIQKMKPQNEAEKQEERNVYIRVSKALRKYDL